MKFRNSMYATIFAASAVFASCFSPVNDSKAVDDGDGLHNLVINVISINQNPFTRAAGTNDITRLDLAVFDVNNKKVVKIDQIRTDEDFLRPSISLPDGNYKLVLIAHSGKGIATITSPTEVSFSNNKEGYKLTDTFLAYKTFSISDDTPMESEMNLDVQRVVAMLRLIMTDTDLPENLSQFEFYYKGGSSTLNPQTGFGSKNSQQREVRSLAEAKTDAAGNRIFEMFTFPHNVDDELLLTITPMDASGNTVGVEHVIEGIPVHPNWITECQGPVFISASGSTLHITINDEWDETIHFDF